MARCRSVGGEEARRRRGGGIRRGWWWVSLGGLSGGEEGGGRRGEESVPVECPVSVEELKEEGRGCLAVDFGGERLRGHCLDYGEWWGETERLGHTDYIE